MHQISSDLRREAAQGPVSTGVVDRPGRLQGAASFSFASLVRFLVSFSLARVLCFVFLSNAIHKGRVFELVSLAMRILCFIGGMAQR